MPEAGRALDALVAEKVMGLIHAQWQTYCDKAHGGGSDAFTSCPVCRPAKYSTEMAAAWEVVEKLSKRAFLFALWNKGHGFVACFSSDDPRYWLESIESGPASMDTVQADTAPLAICRAALQAVGMKEEG